MILVKLRILEQAIVDDISVSSSASQISVIQQKENVEQGVGSQQDKDQSPDSTTDHSTTREEVSISFIEFSILTD